MINVIYANRMHRNSWSHLICKEYAYTVNHVFYFPKNFYLSEAFNNKLSALLASGTISHLIGKYMDMRYWKMKPAKKGPQPLTFENMEGTFILWAALCTSSLVVLTVEVLIKIVARTRPHKF